MAAIAPDARAALYGALLALATDLQAHADDPVRRRAHGRLVRARATGSGRGGRGPAALRLCVMLAEDDSLTHALGAAALVRDGFAVDGAASAEQVLDTLVDRQGGSALSWPTCTWPGRSTASRCARRARILRPALPSW